MPTIANPRAPSEKTSLAEQPIDPFGQSSLQQLASLRPLWGLHRPQLGYDIRPARTPHQYGMASMLVRQMYAWRGYNSEATGHGLDDPNRVTLTVWQYDEIVATLTLARDSSDGLLADALYARELERLRHPNRVICEVSRLAVDPDFSSKHMLNSLFRAAIQYARDIFSASDAVFEVNPRHQRFYQQHLGFQQIGSLRQCPRVDAPAVLLHQALSDIFIPQALPAMG